MKHIFQREKEWSEVENIDCIYKGERSISFNQIFIYLFEPRKRVFLQFLI